MMKIATALIQCMTRNGSGCSRRALCTGALTASVDIESSPRLLLGQTKTMVRWWRNGDDDSYRRSLDSPLVVLHDSGHYGYDISFASTTASQIRAVLRRNHAITTW